LFGVEIYFKKAALNSVSVDCAEKSVRISREKAYHGRLCGKNRKNQPREGLSRSIVRKNRKNQPRDHSLWPISEKRIKQTRWSHPLLRHRTKIYYHKLI